MEGSILASPLSPVRTFAIEPCTISASPVSPVPTFAIEPCTILPSLGRLALQELVLREVCVALGVPRTTINIHSNFTELGGHSLSAIGIVSACKSHGVRLSVESILLSETIFEMIQQARPMATSPPDELIYLKPTTSNATLKPKFAAKRAAETRLGAAAKRLRTPSLTVTTSLANPSSSSVRVPMTEMQLSLIGGGQANPGTNVISLFETYQTKDIPVMKRAWKAIIESESIFRTSFDLSEGNANLVLQPTNRFSWTETVVHDQDAYDSALEENQADMGVNTSFQVVTWQKGWQAQSVSTIIWRVHHALIDGYSATLVYRKLHRVAAGHPASPGTPFAEVAQELQDLQHASRPASQNFWKHRQEESQGAVGDIFLPTPSTKAFSHNVTRSVTVSLPSDAIMARARQSRVSLASMHHAAWALVLSMYSDSDSVVFGVVLSGRDLPLAGVEDTVGPLINTLPLHVKLNASWTTTEYLRHVFSRMVELNSVQCSRPEDGYVRKFSSALTTEFEMTAPETGAVQPLGKSYFTTATEIPLSVFVAADSTLRLCYHCNTFNKKDIERLGEHYRRAILALLEPSSAIGFCMDNGLTNESRDVLRKFGNSLSDDTVASSIHDDLVTLFERATTKHPDAIAVEKADQKLTYRGLNSRADRIAEHLKQFIQPGEAVCVNADRSLNWIISIYGILKAGGVYSPQDKALPPAVRDSNFQSAGAKVFLVSSVSDLEFKPRSCQLCFAVEDLLSDCQTLAKSHSELLPKLAPTPSANAYICFTSGSTGKPKGVVCTHEGLVAFQKTPEVRLFAEPGRKISQIMSPAFDGSIHEIFSALSYGATLVLSDSPDPFSHLRLVDSAILTPSIAKMLVPDDFPKLSTVSYIVCLLALRLLILRLGVSSRRACSSVCQRPVVLQENPLQHVWSNRGNLWCDDPEIRARTTSQHRGSQSFNTYLHLG
jgi:gliotoxin/aspirochlorine biosynthesis peptide synthetase